MTLSEKDFVSMMRNFINNANQSPKKNIKYKHLIELFSKMEQFYIENRDEVLDLDDTELERLGNLIHDSFTKTLDDKNCPKDKKEEILRMLNYILFALDFTPLKKSGEEMTTSEWEDWLEQEYKDHYYETFSYLEEEEEEEEETDEEEEKKEIKEDETPLTSLDGLGEVIEKNLKEEGIHSVEDLISREISDITRIEGIGYKSAKKWMEQGKRKVA